MTKTILVPVEQKDLGNCFECGNALSVYCSYCNTPEASPKPSIPADDREEVARAIWPYLRPLLHPEETTDWDSVPHRSLAGEIAFDFTDAAISTLQRLGWKK